jgi:class 3 adenylate cyclase
MTPLPAEIALSYGAAATVLGVTRLRRRLDRGVPAVLTTLDFAVFTAVLGAVRQSPILSPGDVTEVDQSVVSGLMLIVATNMLRFSWRLPLWSLFCAAASYRFLHRDQVHTVTSAVDVVQFIALSAMLVWSARRLRTVIRRMQERDAFARFLPGPAVDRLTRDPSALELGGEEHEATVLFADIRGFTTLSESLHPTEVVRLLNEYFQEMVEEIFAWEGILDKFIGDGICAVFGPPLAGEDAARRAIRCAIGMQHRLERLNERRKVRGEPPLKIGIGLHTGPLVAGNVGSPLRMEYTHIGDTVNTASRLEGLTKELGAPIIASESTASFARDDTDLRDLGLVAVRGKPAPMRLYAVS